MHLPLIEYVSVSVVLCRVNSIVEKDIYDKDFHFSTLRGKNVYIVNVASEDGDSSSNYQILQKISALRNEKFEVIIFPCNQFGEKEPRSQRDIAFFARKHGFRGVIRPSFRYLKANTDNIHIDGCVPSV